MGVRERPLLKPWYRVGWTSGACLLEYGGAAVSLEGSAATRLLPALLPLLDGRRTVVEIEAALGAAVAPAVRQALDGLEQAGVLTDGPPPRDTGPPERAAALAEPPERAAALAELLSHCSPVGQSPWDVAGSLGASTIAVGGSGETAELLARLLGTCGIGSVGRLAGADLPGSAPAAALSVLAPAPSELAVLAEVNELALERELPWLQVVPYDGHAAYVGPLFLPGATCCHRCFLLRRASTSGYRDELAALQRVPPAHGVSGPVAAIVAGFAAMLALRWLTARDACLPGRVWAVELWPSPSVSEHVVYRVPRCPACSGTETAARPSPWFETPVAIA
jgi:bacteriocin biosynthesis cyclodehydratase domain-containing protein